jgi:hypothetical protein
LSLEFNSAHFAAVAAADYHERRFITLRLIPFVLKFVVQGEWTSLQSQRVGFSFV